MKIEIEVTALRQGARKTREASPRSAKAKTAPRERSKATRRKK